MPDTPLADRDGGPYDPPLERRVARLEEDGRQVIAAITRLEEPIARLETRGDRLDAAVQRLEMGSSGSKPCWPRPCRIWHPKAELANTRADV